VLDFHHNAWYATSNKYWWTNSGGDFSSLSAAQSGLSATAGLFDSITQRHTSDVLTVTDPFATDIVLGANHLTEYTATPDGTLSSGTSPKNAGAVVPGITDGYSGAAPDMGAIISGRAAVQYGHTPTTLPTYLQGLALNTWLQLSGTASTNAGGYLGVSAYSGAAYDTLRGRILLNGGGHFDGANNGIWAISLRQNTPSVAQIGASSPAQPDNVEAYPDGKPSARHTYRNIVYCSQTDHMMLLGGAGISGSQATTLKTWGFDLATNTWHAINYYPDRAGTAGFGEQTCVDSAGIIYLHIPSQNDIRKWTPGSPGSYSNWVSYDLYYDHQIAFDSNRNRVYYFGGLNSSAAYWNSAGAVTTFTFGGANSGVGQAGNSWEFVPELDKFLGVEWDTSPVQVYQFDPVTFAVTTYAVAGTKPPYGNGGGNSQYYGRWGKDATLGIIFFVPDGQSNTWVFRYK
jgi:hypothetical protein